MSLTNDSLDAGARHAVSTRLRRMNSSLQPGSPLATASGSSQLAHLPVMALVQVSSQV
jgi:hypothetical protein